MGKRMKYQIQNHLGEVIADGLTLEELSDYGEFDENSTWITKVGLTENYFLFDSEDDLVTRWTNNPEGDVQNYKIIKVIEE